MSRQEAIKELGDGIYDAPLVALAKPGSVQDIIEKDIQELASSLRFNSSKDRLSLPDPERIDGKQLQSMRELTLESSHILQAALEAGGAVVRKQYPLDNESDEAATMSQEQAAGFQSNPAIRRAVEKFAMSKAHPALTARVT